MRLGCLFLSVLALAGCGGGGNGGSDSDYAHGLISALGSVEEPATLGAAGLTDLADDYRRAADELSRLTPPATIAEAHARMIAAMRAYSDDLRRAAELTADQAGFLSVMSQAQTNAQAWTSAFEEIKAQGYATAALS
jgi:hypothetical protein